MKIALITDGIAPIVIGGMQKHSINLAKNLANSGVFVDLYHYIPNNANVAAEPLFTDKELEFIHEYKVDFPKSIKLPGHYIRNSKKYAKNIYNSYLQNGEVDIIYCKGFAAWEFAVAKSKGISIPPLFVNFHGYEMFQNAPDIKSHLQKKWILQKPVKFVLSQADCIMSYGGKISNLLLENGVPQNKIIEIPGGIDPDWINPKIEEVHNPKRFVFIGRFERRKGIQELTESIKTMQNDNFHFTFIGPIPQEHQIEASNIEYKGELRDTKQIKAILCESDVLVCPSYSEGMPNVILEAMASGCAIIATDVGAVASCVSSENGIIINPGSAAEIVSAMQRIIEMKDAQLNEMKRISVKKIESNYVWTRIASKHIEAFKTYLE